MAQIYRLLNWPPPLIGGLVAGVAIRRRNHQLAKTERQKAELKTDQSMWEGEGGKLPVVVPRS